jgi:TetR/AcrR family transcriptional regulator, transcriptional repressor for nem operon
MRYPPEHKAEVRQRIVRDAALRLRGEGLNGAAVATVMRDTGLTHGGFYKHFASKDDLLAESLEEAFQGFISKLVETAEQTRSGEPWKAIVKSFLSVEHCNEIEQGCPLAALASELARMDEGMKAKVLANLIDYKDQMVRYMPGRRKADKERAFFGIFSTMIGAVQLARTIPDLAAKETVLASARDLLLRSF